MRSKERHRQRERERERRRVQGEKVASRLSPIECLFTLLMIRIEGEIEEEDSDKDRRDNFLALENKGRNGQKPRRNNDRKFDGKREREKRKERVEK